MARNTTGYLMYKAESTFGVRNPDPFLTTTDLYALGEYLESPSLPDIDPMVVRHGVSASHNPAELSYGRYGVSFPVTYCPVNGIGLKYALGSISNAGSDPYTHTITGITPGTDLPSRTFHFEELGGTEPLYIDLCGGTTRKYQMIIDRFSKSGVMVKEDIVGASIVDNSAGNDPSVALDDKVQYQTGSGSTPYFFDTNTVVTHGGNDIKSLLDSVTITIDNNLEAVFPNRSTTDKFGVSNNRWADAIRMVASRESPARTISATLEMRSTGDTYSLDFWDALMAGTLDNDLVVKVQRSANDYIQYTFDTSYCLPRQISGKIPQSHDNAVVGKLFMVFPASVSVEVKDSIAGGAFE